MRIHRLIIICLVATSLLASCKKEEKPNAHGDLNLDGISFTATTEGHDRNAKTYLDGEDIKWMAGDLILVQNSASRVQQAPFEVVDGLQTMNGTFYTGSTFDRSPAYDAAYPYSMATLSGTTATFTLPQQQQMTVTGTFGNGAMPMVAHSTNNVLNFYNVCGGVCFPLQGAGKHVTKIVLTSKNTDDKLWGTFTASTTAVPVSGNVTSGPMPTHVSDGSNSVELICNGSTGITLTAEPQDFYIMVPPQTMKSGFTVTVYDGPIDPANVIYSQDINWDAATHANFIKRSVVSKVQTAITISDPLTVTTVSPTFISTTQAYGQGTVASDVANNITERGMCWALASVTTTPTIANSYKAEGGTATGAFALMFGDTNPMTKDCVYYVRAYAKNAAGEVFYGDPIPFATRKDYSNDYNGRMPYAFSVSASQQVNFSMGNLQYKASTNTWRFAEYQFEYVGNNTYGNVYANGEHPDASQNGTKSNNANVSSSYNQWIDLFGWGTSGYNHGAVAYQPWSTNDEDYDYYAYNNDEMHLYNGNGTADWGYNRISNGGNQLNQWRSLREESGGATNNTYCELSYLFTQRSASTINGTTNARWSKAKLTVRSAKNIFGVILYPDNYTWPTELTHYAAAYNDGTWESANNQWNEAEWSLLEHNGAVFFPVTGTRFTPAGCMLVNFDAYANYWMGTVNEAQGMYDNCRTLWFDHYRLNFDISHHAGDEAHGCFVRCGGLAVRLVRNI